MRRKRLFRHRRYWRRGHWPDDALVPLLSAVRSEAPPEGLLQRIERELESTPIKPGARSWITRRGLFVPFAAIAGLGAVVMFLVIPQEEYVALLDPTGSPVAHMNLTGDTVSVHMIRKQATQRFDKAWHLWGIAALDGVPQHLGPLGDGIVIQNPARFSRYALSMEDRDFAGDQPVGPVILLAAEK